MSIETATSVHNIETSVGQPLPDSYHDYRKSFHADEYARTAEIYAELDKKQGKARLDLLTLCRTFAWFTRHKETGKVRVVASACHLRWCPICSSSRSSYLQHAVADWMKDAKAPKLLTFTLQHSNAPLSHTISSLYQFFRKIRLLKGFVKSCRGGIWFFQLKWIPETDEWHPHLHCIIDSDWIPHKWLSEQWLRITSTSHIVDIRPIRKIEDAAKHLSRYCARPCALSKLPFSRAIECVTAMHGRRMCGTWGNGNEASLKPPLSVDRDKWENLGNWRTVIGCFSSMYEAKAILKAWQTDTSLAEGISLCQTDRFIDGLTTAIETAVDKYKQPYLYDQ